MRAVLISLLAVLPIPLKACDLALILAVDVSGSVDPEEYAIQRDGLARALADSVVAEALVRAKARVAIVQWTGASRQQVTVPWIAVEDYDQARRLAGAAASDPRVWWQFSTAIGEAIALSLDMFAEVPECRRRVIDISGDGVSNEGRPPESFRAALRAADVTINAVVIETDGKDLRGYFWENVIHGEGAFVVTASGFEQYAARIREKLIREVADQIGTGPLGRDSQTNDRAPNALREGHHGQAVITLPHCVITNLQNTADCVKNPHLPTALTP